MANRFFIIPIMAFLAVGVFLSLYLPSLSAPRNEIEVGYLNTCSPAQGSFTIIANSHGFNDSISHGAPANPWPIINVGQGDKVRIVLCNLDNVETHGFAIDHYFDAGVVLRPGQAYQVSFMARDSGSFRIFCNVFCTVHAYMLGSLVVS